MTATFAILPVKRFDAAKQRLASALEPQARVALAEAMVRDVLLALAGVAQLEGTIVVTGEPRAAALARHFGAQVVGDPDDAGHNPAAARGVAHAMALGANRVLLVPGDCPALDPDEVAGLLSRTGPGVVVVPDRHGTGTNALLLQPPQAITPAFGPGSRERHVELARGAGVAVEVAEVRSLAFDADTHEDLAALQEHLRRRNRPTATAAALGGLEPGRPPAFAEG